MTPNKKLKDYPIKDLDCCKIHGRTDPSQYPLPLFWTGSAVEVDVTGTELWIDIEVDYEVYEPWGSITINGCLLSRQMLSAGRQKLCLFRGWSPDTVKNVLFTRETQAMSGDPSCHLLIYGFSSDGEFIPVADKPYKLEFIGDSITTGEGTYGATQENDWVPAFMSISTNYASMTAQKLHADYRILSQSGWGVVSSWDNHPECNMSDCYEQICGLCDGAVNQALGAQKPNDFLAWQPDAIIVNLGTNDCGAFDQPACTNPETGEVFQEIKNADGTYDAACIARFEAAVVVFLKKLRKNNKKAKIVWVYGMLGYDLTFPITNALHTYRLETGDRNTYFLQPPMTVAETIGSRCHPGPKNHEIAAAMLSDYLKALLLPDSVS